MKLRLQVLIYFWFLIWTLGKSQTDTIKFCIMGSSSFSDELAETARKIAEASGDYYVTFERKGGYFRFDYFGQDSMLYVNWKSTYQTQIEAGNYDFVIMQSFGYGGLNPDQLNFLVDWLIPDISTMIQNTGAKAILYDKYPGYGCYFDPVYFSYLCHIDACVKANIDKVTFNGGAMWEMREVPYWQSMGFLMDGEGHPGAMANYVTACNMSYLMTGVDPRGNSIRNVPLQGWAYDTWAALPDTDPKKSRVVDGELILTEWEADSLQRIAMRYCLKGLSRLDSNINDADVYDATLEEIYWAELQYGQYRDWGYDQGLIDNLDNLCDQGFASVLSADEISDLRNKVKQISNRVLTSAALYLSDQEILQLQIDFENYWTERNTKFRDDVYFLSLVELAVAKKDGDVTEISRLTEENQIFGEIMSQAAENMLLQRLSPIDRADYLSTYSWGTPLSSYSPEYGTMQLDSVHNWQQLVIMREIYFDVWEDPNLQDQLRDFGYPMQPWLDADSIFVNKWDDLLALNASGEYLLAVMNGSGSGYYTSGENINVFADIPAVGRHFETWDGDTHLLDNALLKATSLNMPERNACVVATFIEPPVAISGLNFSFETPDIAEYEFNPSGASWSWSAKAGDDGAGIVDYAGTAITDGIISAPDGNQMCFLKGSGWISQNIDFPDDNYGIVLKAAQRPVYQDATQTFVVKIDGDIVGTFTPAKNDTFYTYTTDVFVANGIQTLSIEGTNPLGGVNTALIDDIKIYNVQSDEEESPTVPTGLNALGITTNSFTLSWTASTDNVGVTAYEVYLNGSHYGETSQTSLNINNLSCEAAYSMQVRAGDEAGNWSELSTELSLNTSTCPPDNEAPSIPDGLAATNITSSSFILSWNASTDNQEVDLYEVFKDDLFVGSTASTSFAITNQTSSSSYNMTVRAKDKAGNRSAQSTSISVTTFANTSTNVALNKPVMVDSYYNSSYIGSMAVDGDSTENASRWVSEDIVWPHWIEIDLEGSFSIDQVKFWTGYNSYSFPIEDYQIQSWNGSSWEDIISRTGNSDPTVDEAFSSVLTTKLRLYATAGSDNLLRLFEIAVYGITSNDDDVNPDVPVNLTSAAITHSSFVLSWNEASDNIGVASYEVYQNETIIADVSDTTMEVTGLSASTLYSMSVIAKDVAGNTSAASTALDVTTLGDPVYYTLTVNNGTGSGDFGAGTVVPVSANTPSVGKTFDAWVGNIANLEDVNAANTSITMPTSVAEITATYIDLTFDISFSVTYGTTPIEGASVTFNSQSINTDAGGQAVFTDVVYGTGRAYTITKTDFDDVNGTVDVINNITQNVLMTLTDPTYTVIFTVNDGTDPLQGANVNFNSQDVLTNASGQAIFFGIANGTGLTYTVTMSGYDTETESVDVSGADVNETVTLSLTSVIYTLTVNNGTGSGDYEEGVTVNITADAALAGQQFDTWTGDISLLSTATASSTSFIMPANTVSLTATYKDLPPETFTVTITNGNGSGEYAEGATVSISADPAPTEQEFDQWIGDTLVITDVSAKSTVFLMPDSAIELIATYKDITLIDDIAIESFSLNMFPNPANQMITISSNVIITNIQIITIRGEVVMDSYPVQQKVTLNISAIAKGVHFVKITAANERHQILRLVNN